MRSQLPLNALRTFEVVARAGSFAAAAIELHVTASAVSHQIRGLEEWLGGSLLERSGQRVRLLPHGALLANVLSSTLNEIATACRHARQARNLQQQLVIAVIPSVATCWLIPNLSEFRSAHPEIAPRVVYAIHGQPIDFAEVDVAIVWHREPPKIQGARLTTLLSGASAPVCNPAFLELKGPLDTSARIAAAGILHDTDMFGWRQWLSKFEGRPVMPPEGPLFEDFNLLRAATLAGQGISLCPLSIIHDDLVAGRLIQLSDIRVLEQSAYYLLQSDQALRAQRPEVALFVEWLMALGSRLA